MNFYFRLVCLLAASLMATHALSQDLSGWSDKTVCRLVKATPENVEYQAESTKRGLSCGVAVTSYSYSSSSSSAKSNKTLHPNRLKQIKVIKDWEPVADLKLVKEYVKLVPIPKWTNGRWNCIDRIKNVNPYPDQDTHQTWFSCQSYVHAVSSNNPQILADILLTWASASKDPMIVVPFADPRHTTAGYDLPSTIGTFAQSYAFWYDEITYTPDERNRVDYYMTKKLMEQKFAPIGRNYKGPFIKCNINDINSVLNERTGTNNCGNIRIKVAVGEIMLGFRLENQALLDKGHDDIYVVLAFINEDGVNINHASRGGNTLNYSWEYTYYSSLLAELYTTVGYDYLEHTLPHGAKVHEHLSFNYRLLKDFKLTAPWAKHNVGSSWLPYSQIKNLSQAEYQKTENGQSAYRWKDGDKEFVKAHTKFVKRYMPQLYTFAVQNYMGSNFNESPNFGIHPYMLHLGNNFIEENNNVERLQKQAEVEDEKIEEQKTKRIENASKLSKPYLIPTDFSNVDRTAYVGSDFEDLKIPDNFDFVDETALMSIMESPTYKLAIETHYGWKREFNATGCKVHLQEFERVREKRGGTSNDGYEDAPVAFLKNLRCRQLARIELFNNPTQTINDISEVLLHHAQNRNVYEKRLKTVNDAQYEKYMLMAFTGEFYAYFKDMTPYSVEEHKLVRSYLDEVFMGMYFHTQEGRGQCDVKTPIRNASVASLGRNGCGSYSLNMLNAHLAYALSTNNQELFTQAKMNVTHFLGSFDNEGIQTSQASRGGLAYGYHTTLTESLGGMTELFYSMGYDFLSHRMPRSGIQVRDVFAMHVRIMHDHLLLEPYAKYNRGVWIMWDEVKDKSTNQVAMSESGYYMTAMGMWRYITEERPDQAKYLKGSRNGNWRVFSVPVEYQYKLNKARE
ncbi:hypothetical protein OAB29_06270 [Oceanospirillaceae bacterium]|nr:hypothetical protein [Oceanospirillaceae bacterium]